jgi:DNA primase
VTNAKTLKASLDLVEIVIQHGIELKRAGSSFKGRCPFHNDSSPSFFVSPTKQLFHCFGCGAGGDVFAFVQRIEHLTFPQAVQKLSRWTSTFTAGRA